MNSPSSEDPRLGRREFLKKTAQVVAVGSAFSGMTKGVTAASAGQTSVDAIPRRRLGKTGVTLPLLAYGGAALPRMWGNRLSFADRIDLVRYAYERGIRYFDTAGNYVDSQEILGRALKEVRDEVFMTTKIETTRPDEVRRAVEKTLSELRMDRLDGLLIHGTPGLQQMSVKQAMEVRVELAKLRDEKICRFLGFSAHGYFDKALALIRSGGFELCMLSYGYIPRGYDQVYSPRMIELRNACLAEARERDMGVIAMKVVGAGLLGARSGQVAPGFDQQRQKGLPGAAIRWALEDERVDLLCIGMREKAEIDANILTVAGDARCTSEDRSLLMDYCVQAYESDALQRMKIE